MCRVRSRATKFVLHIVRNLNYTLECTRRAEWVQQFPNRRIKKKKKKREDENAIIRAKTSFVRSNAAPSSKFKSDRPPREEASSHREERESR